MQEMMKTMMDGSASEEEMAEMQSQLCYLCPAPISDCIAIQK